MHIITNWKPRALVAWCDLPESARADFDYVDAEDYSSRFFHYRGTWYDAHDAQRIEPDSGRAHPMGWAMRVHPGSPLNLFDAVASDTYFSGTLWRFTDDDSVIVARYYS
jgi:hypothetical protein